MSCPLVDVWLNHTLLPVCNLANEFVRLLENNPSLQKFMRKEEDSGSCSAERTRLLRQSISSCLKYRTICVSCLRVWVTRHPIFVRLLWFLVLFPPHGALRSPSEWQYVPFKKKQTTHVRSQRLKRCLGGQLRMALLELSKSDSPLHTFQFNWPNEFRLIWSNDQSGLSYEVLKNRIREEKRQLPNWLPDRGA